MSKKHYIITGATSGIGKDISLFLAKKNYILTLIIRDIEKYNEYFDQFDNCSPIIIDLINVDNISQILDEKLKLKIDGLILCAGIEETFPLKMYKPNRLNNIFQINFNSNFELLRYFSNKQKSNNNSSFVVLSSIMSVLGQPGKTAYCSTKHALIGLVKSMALEVADRNIRVNAISPGVVDTPMTRNLFNKLSLDNIERIKKMHPLGIGNTEDILHLINFLISRKSKWITGQNIIIDGGYSLQ